MVGLDAAGKTTVLKKLKLGEVEMNILTIGLNVETVEYNNFQQQGGARPRMCHIIQGRERANNIKAPRTALTRSLLVPVVFSR